jgi:GT2 family glycosyltransferase
MTPNIWISLLTYNGAEDTRKCLHSLAGLTYPTFSVVVVDNASTDAPIPMVQSEFPWCHVVENPENLGFAGGNNRGIEYALAHGADWVVLLNNDTTVAPDFLDRLAEAAAAHPEFAIIGPVINYMDEPDVVMTDGVVFNTPDFHGFFKRKPVEVTRATPPAITEVDVVNGCCMMIAAPVFRTIGLIDERFFIYHEEMDFCLRARRAGVRCGVIDHQLVWHKGTSSFKKTGKRLPRYYDARNLVLLLWKHSGARHHGRTLLGTAEMYLRYIYYRYCVEREDGHDDSADAVIEGFWDALRGRYGRFVPGRRLAVPAIRMCFEAGRHRPRLLSHGR